MKNKNIILIISAFFFLSFVNAQDKAVSNYDKALKNISDHGEVYFSFQINNAKNINFLSKVISIDKIENTNKILKVFAYANSKQFKKFNELQIKYNVLTPPSMLFEAKMAGFSKDMQEWDSYPTYETYVQMMVDFANNYPELCILDTLGTSVENRLILAMKISDNVKTDEPEPEFYYTSTMHGDEVTGYVLMLRLIDYLLTNYNSIAEVKELVDNVEIWINPLSNPDGTYAGGNSTVNGATRYNANGVDLNRNYPDPQDGLHPDGHTYQSETQIQMNFMQQHHFLLSANFHGGAEVVNYPWDTWSKRHADDTWYRFISREYADSVHSVNSSYMTDLNNGVTNGYDWYEVAGGRQDYVNYFLHSREVTIELSYSKTPSASSLPTYWNYNKNSFLNFIQQCRYGIQGTVTDSTTKIPLNAMIYIENHDEDSSMVFTESSTGNFYRLIEPGTWDITFSAYGYIPKTITGITTSDYNTTYKNVVLVKAESVNINGIVNNGIDTSPVDSVKIELLNTPLEAAFTNNNGSYQINNVMEGNYTIRISKQGFASVLQYITVTKTDTTFNYSIYPTVTLTFETGNFSEADFSFAGNADWQIDQQIAYSGNYSAKSGSIANQESTVLQLNLNVLTDGEISFYRKVSSESGFDFLTFYIDNEKMDEWSGEQNWNEESYTITQGVHTVSWKYIKDYLTVGGSDAAWIDNITLPVTDTDVNYRPEFISNPITTATVNISYLYRVVVSDLNTNDTLTITCEKPDWLNFIQNSNTSATLSGTPTEENIGTDTILITVTDNKDTVFQNFTLSIIPNSIDLINNIDSKIKIYPNPAINSTIITFVSYSNENYDLIVFNEKGTIVLSKNISSSIGLNTINLTTSKLLNGIYFVRLSGKSYNYFSKFLKQ